MTLSELWPTFQNHDNIQRAITSLIVSRVWSIQWFRFQWPWVTVNLDFKVTGLSQRLSTYCVRSLRAICVNIFTARCAVCHAVIVPKCLNIWSTFFTVGSPQHSMAVWRAALRPVLAVLVAVYAMVQNGSAHTDTVGPTASSLFILIQRLSVRFSGFCCV